MPPQDKARAPLSSKSFNLLKKNVSQLCQWYSKRARDLPWRHSQDPYRIWISEVMLQQTQVATVLPYYQKFIHHFPTVFDLAKAKEQRVLSLWAGLGYYSRARNLHRGAKFIVEEHAGKFPRSRVDLLKVPGIGPYTCGAILSIAFDLPEPIVDGNVQRVFSRYYAVDQPIELSQTQKRFWSQASDWVKNAAKPSVLNQALMELGATVCSKSSPDCQHCPLSTNCEAKKQSRQLELPRRRERKKPVSLFWMGLILEYRGRLFLTQNSPQQWWSDMWDLPRLEVKNKVKLSSKLSQLVRENASIDSWKALGLKKHTVTHHKIHYYPYLIRLNRKTSITDRKGRWFHPKELADLPVSSLVKKALSLCPNPLN